MALVENRAAENGSEIITDTDSHVFTEGNRPSVVRFLEDTVLTSIAAPNCTGIAYYVGPTFDVTSPVILANVSEITLASGAVQVVYS